MKKTLMMVGFLAALTASSTFAAGVVTTYSTLAGWQAAVGNQSLETFTNTTQAFTTFTLLGNTPDSYLGSSSQFYGVGTNVAPGGPTPREMPARALGRDVALTLSLGPLGSALLHGE